MTNQLFFSDGTHVDSVKFPNAQAGQKVSYKVPCYRCAGVGQFHTYGVCYRCLGGRWDVETRKVYTHSQFVKYQERKDAAQDKKRKKVEAVQAERKERAASKHAELISEITPYSDNKFVKSIIDQVANGWELSEVQVSAVRESIQKQQDREKNPSEYVGTVGERIQVDGKVTFSWVGQSQFGMFFITEITDSDGNVFTYKGSRDFGDKEAVVSVKAKIKEHEIYKGVKRTVISNPR